MLVIISNPLKDPIIKLLEDIKATKWQFPYLLQTFHFLITSVLLLILLALYCTVGLVSQTANSFWNVLEGFGERMSFSSPISSLFYAISAVIYFLLFLPFFLLQLPFWIGGWITSKIGFRPLILFVIIVLLCVGILFYKPELSKDIMANVTSLQNRLKNEFFVSDSISIEAQSPIISESLSEE